MRAILRAQFVRLFQILDLERPSPSPSSNKSFVHLDLTMKKYVKTFLPRKQNQPQLSDADDEEPGDVPTVPKEPTEPSTSSSPPVHPIGCETLFEGASPIVAE